MSKSNHMPDDVMKEGVKVIKEAFLDFLLHGFTDYPELDEIIEGIYLDAVRAYGLNTDYVPEFVDGYFEELIPILKNYTPSILK